MRVVIEVESGANEGRKRLLRSGSELTIGRSDYCDLACADDDLMSRQHFVVRTDHVGCQVQDLGSSNGTSVNGEILDRPVLVADGDLIHAGRSRFRITVEGDDPAAARASHNLNYIDSPTILKGTAILHRTRLNGDFNVATCHSQLYSHGGSFSETTPEMLAKSIPHSGEILLLLDCQKAGIQRNTLPVPGENLFTFLDPEIADIVSPAFFSTSDLPDWQELIKDAWGQDAVVVIYSDAGKADTFANFLSVVNSGSDGSVVGACWPRILESMLRDNTGDAVSQLMQGVKSILVESDADGWTFFSNEDQTPMLSRLGLRPILEEASPSNEETTQELAPTTNETGDF